MRTSDDHPTELISAWIDGEVDEGERADLESHLARCASCRELAEDLRALARATASEDVPPVPENLKSRIDRRLREEKLRPATPRWRRVVPLTAAASIAAIGLLAVLRLAGDSAPPVPEPAAPQQETLETDASKNEVAGKPTGEKERGDDLEESFADADASGEDDRDRAAGAPVEAPGISEAEDKRDVVGREAREQQEGAREKKKQAAAADEMEFAPAPREPMAAGKDARREGAGRGAVAPDEALADDAPAAQGELRQRAGRLLGKSAGCWEAPAEMSVSIRASELEDLLLSLDASVTTNAAGDRMLEVPRSRWTELSARLDDGDEAAEPRDPPADAACVRVALTLIE